MFLCFWLGCPKAVERKPAVTKKQKCECVCAPCQVTDNSALLNQVAEMQGDLARTRFQLRECSESVAVMKEENEEYRKYIDEMRSDRE